MNEEVNHTIGTGILSYRIPEEGRAREREEGKKSTMKTVECAKGTMAFGYT